MLISEQVFLELTGDGHGHHIPGSPVVYRHGWKKVVAAPAPPLMHQLDTMTSEQKFHYEEQGILPQAMLDKASAPLVPPIAPPGSQLAEQRRLLTMWTRSFRMSNRTQGTPADAEFINELHRMLTDRTPPDKCGPGCQDAHAFMGMVDMSSEPVKDPLARGMSIPAEELDRLFHPAGTVDLPTTSWTKRTQVAAEYAASHPPRPGYVHAVLHAPPGAMGMDLTPLERGGGSWLNVQAQQDEVLTGGRFTVEKTEMVDGVAHIHLGPQEDYRAH